MQKMTYLSLHRSMELQREHLTTLVFDGWQQLYKLSLTFYILQMFV